MISFVTTWPRALTYGALLAVMCVEIFYLIVGTLSTFSTLWFAALGFCCVVVPFALRLRRQSRSVARQRSSVTR